MARSMLLVGATGAVGRQVLNLALEDAAYTAIVTLGRRPLSKELEAHPKLTHHVVDFENLDAVSDLLKADDVVCALGTTRKQAGSLERFIQIDHGYPLKVAQLSHANGAQRYVLVSSLGANPKSPSSYLKTKGRLEQDIKALGFESFVVLRPSLLLGRDDFRPGEALGEAASKLFSFVLPKRMRGIHVGTIAARIVRIGREDPSGFQVLESEMIGSR